MSVIHIHRFACDGCAHKALNLTSVIKTVEPTGLLLFSSSKATSSESWDEIGKLSVFKIIFYS